MADMHESIDKIARRAGGRTPWWAEPSERGDGLYLVRSARRVIADGLTQRQAMIIAGEYNLARSDAESLAKRRDNTRDRKSA